MADIHWMTDICQMTMTVIWQMMVVSLMMDREAVGRDRILKIIGKQFPEDPVFVRFKH